MSESRQILETIINDFSVDKFSRFFREKNRNFVVREENYTRYDDDNFKDGLKIGEINFSEIEKIIVCSFKVKNSLSERSGKRAQYEKAKNILKSNENRIFSAGIFIFYDKDGHFRFSLVYPESIGTKRQWSHFKRFTYFVSSDPQITNKTFLKQIGEKEFSGIESIKEAFSLSAVTEVFYREFFILYDKIVSSIIKENKIKKEGKAREFVLLFAVRIVFLGFIQKKKWIGDDEKFLQKFFKEYKDNYFGKNKFYSRWLVPLFFEALNSPQGRKVAYRNNDFSPRTEQNIEMAPYLNGGLFRPKNGYDDQDWIIPDKDIEDFFDFLFAHSFTIEENSLDDEDLQLNPEFLGIIFERLVNKADGAVYTPRKEVDLMCRLSLVKWLEKNLELPVAKNNLCELFFRESKKEEDQKEGSFSRKEAEEILKKLKGLAICDPATGSGAFLVGMMQVLDEIEISLSNRFKIKIRNSFERKKQIIGQSLYGVEVKEWAVWISQLRLWLSLFVEASDDIRSSLEPILPSLDFKVRQGDSLVQKVGSKAFTIFGHNLTLSKSIKDKITKLKNLKLEYFDNRSGLKDWELRQRELKVYEEILNIEIKEKETSWRNLKNIKPAEMLSLFGDKGEKKQEIMEFDKDKIEKIEKEISELKEQKELLRKEKPLVWSIEFAEVFSEKKGFDIIIGNPPYVRQEKIEDPMGDIKDKREYKKCLEEMVKLDFPNDFPPKIKINAQSDLYTYFYVRSLRLLNPKGIHTFICSNSWLDVGYGVWLQNFLLKRCPVELIIDNHAKRSFGAADVNTIISVIHAPTKKVDENHLVKFVAFKKPFEETTFTENLLKIENAKKVESNENFRVYPISIKDLKETGTEYEDKTLVKTGKYVGDKWGGKYLRAPKFFLDIYNSNKVKPFSKIVDIKYGVKTGIVKFFCLTKEKAESLKIEKEFLYPAIISSQYINNLGVNSTHYIFSSSLNKEEMKGTKAIEYIEWGENQKNENNILWKNIASVSGRERWYSINGENIDAIFMHFWNQRFFVPVASEAMWCSNNFCYGLFKINREIGKILFNSTFYFLQIELFGNSNQGQGVLTTYMEYDYPFIRMPEINVDLNYAKDIFLKLCKRDIRDIFEECGIDPKSEIPIEEQEPNPLPDRAELDKIVFDALELTEEERKEVYRAVCRLVWNRISKARSV